VQVYVTAKKRPPWASPPGPLSASGRGGVEKEFCIIYASRDHSQAQGYQSFWFSNHSDASPVEGGVIVL